MRVLPPALLALIVCAGIAPAHAVEWQVRTDGNDTACEGLASVPFSGAGKTCAFATISRCLQDLRAGETCTVAEGVYTEAVRPLRSGAEGLPVALVCPSGACRVRPSGATALDLTGLNHITVEGFVFEGKVVTWANGSEGNQLRRIEVRPRPGGPYPEINAGCGRDNTLESFVVEAPRDTNVTPLAIGVNCTAPARDMRSTFRNGFVRGGRNAVSLASCDDCVLDGLTVLGAWNHTFSIDGDVTNLTVRNSVFLASTLFREGIPDSREIHGLTFVNNAVVSGSVFPGYNVPSVADGRIVLRNNVFYNMGHNTAESMLDIFDPGTVVWDIGSNAYVGGGNFNDRTPFWRDGRGGTKRDFFPDYDNDGALGSSTEGLNFTDWQARGSNPDGSAWDTGSVVVSDADYRTSGASYSRPVWGTSAPPWGAIVRCAAGADRFETHSQWGEAVAAGDLIEHDLDGTLRTVTAVATGSCGRQITFTPPLEQDIPLNGWFLSWGRQDPDGDGVANLVGPIENRNRFGFVPAPGSPLVDAGDDAVCGHPVVGGHCDIGPMEFDPGSDLVAPATPVGLVAATGDAGVDLTWAALPEAEGAIGYNVYRRGPADATFLAIGHTAQAGWQDRLGSPSTLYVYVVRAYDAAGNVSAPSVAAQAAFPADATPPTVPGGLTANGRDDGIVLAWQSSLDAAGIAAYRLERREETSGGFTQVAETPSTVWLDATAVAGISYRYRVMAVDPAGNVSAPSAEVVASRPAPGDETAPTAPSVLAAVAVPGGPGGDGRIDLSWQPATDQVGVAAYDILRATRSGGARTAAGTTTGTSWSDTSARQGQLYVYVVVARDAAGNISSPSNEASATLPDTLPPTAPGQLTATVIPQAGGSRVTLDWPASVDNVGVDHYELMRGLSGDALVPIASTTGTEWTDSTVTASGSYDYAVTAVDAAGNRSRETRAAAVVLDLYPPSIPQGLAAVASARGVRLDWLISSDDVQLAGYDIFRKSGGGDWTLVGTSPGPWDPWFEDVTGPSGALLVWAVRARDAAGNVSALSTAVSAVFPDARPPTAPGSPHATLEGNAVRLGWPVATDDVAVTGYEILRSAGGSALPVGASPADTFLDATGTPGVLYAWTIVAIDAAGNRSAASGPVTAVYPQRDVQPPTPVHLVASSWKRGVLLDWSESTDDRGVAYYEIYRGPEKDDVLQRLAIVPAPTYLDESIPHGYSYRYSVVAVDAAGLRSAFSNDVFGRRNAFFVVGAGPEEPATDGGDGTARITVEFSEPVDPSTVRAGTVRLVESGGGLLRQAPGFPRVSADGRRVTVQPEQPLRAGRSCRLVVPKGESGPRSLSGRVATSEKWSISITP